MQERKAMVRLRVQWEEAMELRYRLRLLQEAGADVGSLKGELRQIFEKLRSQLAALKATRKERRRRSPCCSSSSSSPSVASSVGSKNDRGTTAKDELQVINENFRRFTAWFRDPARKRRRIVEEEAGAPQSPSSWRFISMPTSPAPPPSPFSSSLPTEDFIPLKTKPRMTSSVTADSEDVALFGCPSPASVPSKGSVHPAVWPPKCAEENGGEACVFSGTLLSSWETLPSPSPLSPSASASSSIPYPLSAFSSYAQSASSFA